MGVYQALKELVDYEKKAQQDITYDNYYFKCGEKMLNQQEYDMNSVENSMLQGLYLLYEIKLDGVVGVVDIYRDSRSMEFQKEFYTKLFIYDKIHQVEKENGVTNGISRALYKDFVVEFNTTTNIDGEQTPKRAMDVFENFAKKELKEDKEFLEVIHTFCDSKIEMTFSCNREEMTPIHPSFPTGGKEEESTSNKKQAKIIQFCKKAPKQ